MGVDTYAFIKSDSDGIFKYIKDNFDPSVTMETHRFNENDPEEREMYIISFMFGDEERNIHIHNMQFGGVYVDKEERWYFKKYGTKKESSSYLYHKDGVPDKTPGVICSLRFWGSSVLIMDLLSAEFGGWIDENDCDSERYRKGANNIRELVDFIFTKYNHKD